MIALKQFSILNDLKGGDIESRVKWSESLSVVSNSLQPHGLFSPWNSPGQNTGVGSLSFLQGIFPTQESNPGLPHCRRILYQLSQKGSPRILEWVAYPSSSRSFWSRGWTRVSWIAGGFFINWAIREVHRNQRGVVQIQGRVLVPQGIYIITHLWVLQQLKTLMLGKTEGGRRRGWQRMRWLC